MPLRSEREVRRLRKLLPAMREPSAPLLDHPTDFAEAIRAGLHASPKTCAPKWLYDELGSLLFEAITLLPEYDLMRLEDTILATAAPEILRQAGYPEEIVELGSGTSRKTRHLLDAALAHRPSGVRYRPIDISAAMLQATAERLEQVYPTLTVAPLAGEYLTTLQGGACPPIVPRLVLFLGSNIGNYVPQKAHELLHAIAAISQPGDHLLLGVDRRRHAAEHRAAYDDALGVTAAFARNLLVRMNRELRTNVDVRSFRYVTTYHEEDGVVKNALESITEQTIELPQWHETIHFEAGERILIEVSYKYDDRQIRMFADTCGFDIVAVFSDSTERFSDVLMRRRAS